VNAPVSPLPSAAQAAEGGPIRKVGVIGAGVMGAGIAASRTPDPRATRLRNLGTHAVYGIGLYASAVVLAFVWPSLPAG